MSNIKLNFMHLYKLKKMKAKMTSSHFSSVKPAKK